MNTEEQPQQTEDIKTDDVATQEAPLPEAPAPTPAPSPVQPWPEQPPAQAQIQYVVAKQPLEGISGWLMFWLVAFALVGILFMLSFIGVLSTGVTDTSEMILAIFAPIIAIADLATVVLIAMRKKIGIWASVAAIGVSVLYVVSSVVSDISGSSPVSIIGSIGIVLVFGGLAILYFVASKRVKQTLIN